MRTPSNNTYAYDYLGNLTTKESTTLTYDNAAKPHTLTKINGTSVPVPDANGNRMGKPGQSYGYNADDRVETITVGSTTVQPRYDYSGQQVLKVVGASVTRYYGAVFEASNDGYFTKHYVAAGLRIASQRVWAPGQFAAGAPDPTVQVAQASPHHAALVLVLRQDIQTGVALSVVVLGTGLLLAPWRRKRVVGIAVRHGHVVAVVLAFGLGTLPWPLAFRPLEVSPAWAQATGTISHYHVDHLGSTQVITDSGGAWVQQLRYKPYGEIRYTLGSSPNRYQFTQYETDSTSGLEYAGARFYDPALGMFLTHDPARQFANPYAYGPWDPINGTDPNGELWELFVIAFVIGFAVSAIQAGVNGASFAEAMKAGAISGAITGVAAVTGLGVLKLAGSIGGPWATYGVAAAMIGGGGYSTVEAFSSGQYVVGAAGAVFTALGLYGLSQGPGAVAKGVNDAWGAQGGNGQTPGAGEGFGQEKSGIGGGQRVGPHRIMSVDVNQSGPAQMGDPLNGVGRVTQGYVGSTGHHGALDIAAPEGTSVYAAGEGVVSYAGPGSGYGRYIDIQDVSFDLVTRYGHESSFAPGIGVASAVQRGQLIRGLGSGIEFGLKERALRSLSSLRLGGQAWGEALTLDPR